MTIALYAQLSNSHSIVSIDLESGNTAARLDLPIADGVTEADWDFEAPHHGLALNAAGNTLLWGVFRAIYWKICSALMRFLNCFINSFGFFTNRISAKSMRCSGE